MEPDLLAGGREPACRPATLSARRLLRADGQAVLVGLLAVLAAAVLALPGLREPAPAAPVVRSLPRVVLTQARVQQVRPQADGVLAVALRLEGLAGLEVLSLRVELPGTVVVLEALPDALSPDGDARVGLSLLPRCPQGVQGLTRGAVVAAVRRPGGPVRQARVRIDAGPALPVAVRQQCGAATDPLGAVVAVADGAAAPGTVRVRVLLGAQGRPVTVVGVLPGPGLAIEVSSALPLVLAPDASPVPLLVQLRAKGCGGAPDTPPFLLLLADGSSVAVSVAPALRPAVDALRPFRCTTP